MATKKNFTSKQKDPLMEELTAKKTSDTKSVSDAKDTSNISDTNEEVFRFSARFTPAQWRFLQEKKWTESAKCHKSVSITSILQEYVEEDMKKHPEIIKTIDQLNG